MGRDFYSIDEAARRLGKSKRTVYNYIDKGFLAKESSGEEKGVRKTDVEQLAIDLGSDAPAMNRANWFQMNARLERMEREMLVVKRILEIRGMPLRPDAAGARGLFAAATESLARGCWSVEEMELWSKQFDAFDETTLRSIAAAMKNTEAWQPFFNLCVNMMERAEALQAAKPTLEGQALVQRLDEGRKKLRGTVLMWLSAGQGLLPEAVLASLETPQETVSRKLGAG